MKINYEIYTTGDQKKIQEFQSSYQYQEGQRIFVEFDGGLYSLLILAITHNHTGSEPITRLNCNPKRYRK